PRRINRRTLPGRPRGGFCRRKGKAGKGKDEEGKVVSGCHQSAGRLSASPTGTSTVTGLTFPSFQSSKGKCDPGLSGTCFGGHPHGVMKEGASAALLQDNADLDRRSSGPVGGKSIRGARGRPLPLGRRSRTCRLRVRVLAQVGDGRVLPQKGELLL